jgi:2-polyprenyl-3-methyl-5-hydroxy-6-metoxy-1,4-benzoquinol methylase
MRQITIGTDFKVLNQCVACGHSSLELVIDLGDQTLANEYRVDKNEFEEFPLQLLRCMKCTHSQISIAVNPDRLFRDYSYVSSTSTTLSRYFEDFRDLIIQDHGTTGNILDIGSNDGSFLQKFNDLGWNCIGVDPAINLIPVAHAKGVLTLPTFFDRNTSSLLSENFDVIVAMNVFAHTANPLEILHGIENCLSENGVAYIQTSQANMFTHCQFDTIYHEHISFFNVRSFKALLERTSLKLLDVRIVPIHGDSYLWVISKNQSHDVYIGREFDELKSGLYGSDLYLNFALEAHKKVIEVQEIIAEYRSKQFKIVSYGAAAKGNTFLNFAKLRMDFIVDDTKNKIGKLAPAGGCKVEDPKTISDIKEPCLILIPAWNFAREISEKVKKLRNNPNDKILVYFPAIEFL